MTLRIAIVCALAATACAVPDAGEESSATSSVEQALVGGRDSTAAENYNVLVTRDGTWVGGGILLAPNLVLTDRALVQEIDTSLTSNECQGYKRNKTGLAVQSGLLVDQLSAPIQVVQILTDGSASSCQGALAILELLTPLAGLPIARLSLEQPPTLGEPVRSVGWGHTTGEGTLPTIRQTGDGQVLLAAGGSYQLQQWTVNVDKAFSLTSAPACYFDPGGPLLNANGDVLAVLHDRVAQDPNHPVGKPFAPCVGAFSTATPVANHKAFIERNMQRYGLMPWRSGQATPPAGTGAVCALSQECNSNLCVSVGGQGQCSKECTDTAECGEGSSCVSTATASVCLTDVVGAEEPASCSASHRAGSGAVAGLFSLALMAFGLRRRARARG